MKYTCITSMTQNHTLHIGAAMIESWAKYWPVDCELIIYAEGFEQTSDDSRVKFISWEESCFTEWQEFCKKTTDQSSHRFAKKGFSWLHAMEHYTNDRLAWLDADLLFKQLITDSILNDILPNDKLVALFDCYYQVSPNYSKTEYEDWETRKQFGAESGFVVLNPAHSKYQEYVSNYRSLYVSEKDPSLDRWYDGEVVLSAAKTFLGEVEDLSQHRRTNKTQTPLNHSYLADYMGHIKSKGKKHMTLDQFRAIANL